MAGKIYTSGNHDVKDLGQEKVEVVEKKEPTKPTKKETTENKTSEKK